MRISRSVLALAILVAAELTAAGDLLAQNPPTGAPPTGAPPAGRGGQRGGGRGRGAQIMTLTTTAWADGGQIPAKHAQNGDELSPPLSWSAPPEGTASFVLIVHDANAPTGNGLDNVLHWLVWNIPAASRGLPEGVPHGPQLPDGTRQIGTTGPFYRGPAAPATGPVHNYLFELYALDTLLTVEPVGASVAATRAAVVAAMTGHIRGKAAIVGTFRRPE
jgi:Raf kinase inhibitor-like YbhB/YbcL family protein